MPATKRCTQPPSSPWHFPASERLWRTVKIITWRLAEFLARSPALGRYRTEVVEIHPSSECAGWVEKMLEGLVGVVRLSVANGEGVSPDFLHLPSLAGELHFELGGEQRLWS